MKAQVAVTGNFLDTQAKIVECTDNLVCQTEHTRSFVNSFYTHAFEAGIKMIAPASPAGIALVLKHGIEFGLDSLKCGQSLLEYLRQMISYANVLGQGAPTSAYLTASPVYPLVVDANGRMTGFRSDGSLVQEIPEAQALVFGEEHLVLYPGGMQNTLQISGYAQGTMDLYAFVAQSSGETLELDYSDVAISPGGQMRLDPTESQQPLKITGNGVTETRLPDHIQSLVAESPPAQQPQQVATADTYTPGPTERTWMGFTTAMCILGPLAVLLSIGLTIWMVRRLKA